MGNAVLVVESRPESPERAEEFNAWYDEVHLPEMLSVEGFGSARRYASLDGESYVAIYELQVDVATATANLAAAQAAGVLSKPTALLLDPPPSVRYFEPA